MLTIMTSTIRANKAQAAAGIENHSMGSLAITSSTISENNGYLSGIMNLGKIYLTNVTISGNESEWGDAFLTGGDHSSVFASYVTIADNAGTGFYQVNGGSVYLVNTIIANNDDGNCDTEIQLFLGQNNLSSDDTCAFFGNGSQTGVDPLLGPLADNGGPTWTQALLYGSPAIDSGADWNLPDLLPQPIDQRGVPRPLDGNGDGIDGYDIGAFEFAPEGTLMMQEILIQTPITPPGLFTPQEQSDCYTSPDLISPVVNNLTAGVTYLLDGRNEAGDWYRLWMADNSLCWVPARSGLIDVDSSALLVRETLEIHTPTVTPVGGSGLFTFQEPGNCRSGPGANYDILTSAPVGTAASVDGRNLDASWYRIQLRGTTCWVNARIGLFDSEPLALPVREAPPSPTPVYYEPEATVTEVGPGPATVNCSAYTSFGACIAEPVCDWTLPVGPCVNK